MATLVLSLLAVPLPAGAEHPQDAPNGVTVTFDHDGDNEWWVEVLTKAAGGFVAAMEVRAESSETFRGLQNKGTVDGWTKWGPATAFHIPPGDRVQFRAHVVSGSSGDAAQVDSCLFTHPAGVEECSGMPAPGPWKVETIGEAGISSHAGDMALGDVDNDGRRDVTIGTRNGVYTFEREGGAWSGERVGTRTSIGALAGGDGDADGKREIYAMSGDALVRFDSVGGVWSQQVLMTFTETFAGDMTFGDIDGLPGRELYIGLHETSCDPETHLCSSSATVHKVHASGGEWGSTPVASLSGHVDSMWVGDGDRDGDNELYVGHGTRHADRVTQIQSEGGAWEANALPGTGSGGGFSLVVAGDGDRSGLSEVYTLNYEGHMRQITHGASGWTTKEIFWELRTPEGLSLLPQTLFLGDGDGDGSRELYIGTDRGEVYQVRFTDGAWFATRVADPFDEGRDVAGGSGLIVVGDGDGDGASEVYAGVSFQAVGTGDDGVTRVFQIKAPGSGFAATFTGVRGNEWWVQANVQASGEALTKVDVSLDGGPWKPLAKQTWGGWAASYHIPQGTVVQLRATSSTAATIHSDCYQWIPPSGQDAAKTPCAPAPPPSGFDASFTGVRGNEWWVQANVRTTGEALAAVHVSLDDGTWKPLAKQSWGGWAASYHIPAGTVVQLRATSSTGTTDLSDCYRWIPPSGTDASTTTCAGTEGFDATFRTSGGNEWWVEVYVEANEPLAGVDARDDGGVWVALQKQTWGAWARSFHVEDGSIVEFRATSSDGDRALSGGYRWPAGTSV